MLFSFLQSSFRSRGAVSPVDLVVRTVCSPVAWLSGKFADVSIGFVYGATGGTTLKLENERLKRQIALLSLYQENVSRLEKEVDQVRKLIDLAPTYQREKVFADVIGYFPADHRITLNVGSRKGIQVGMPIITASGLLGRIQTVSANESQGLLLTSSASKVGGVVPNHTPQPAGLVSGQNSQLLYMTFQTPQSSVVSGDLVVSPSFSERIPSGISIGRVILVESFPETGASRATILPSVNVGSLREVVIVK